MLSLSLLLHAALLLLPLTGPNNKIPRRGAPMIVLDLLPPKTEPSPESKDQRPKPERSPPKEGQQPGEPNEPEARAKPQDTAEQSITRETPSAPDPATPSASTERVQARILTAARALGRETERTGEDKGLQYDSVPDLPSGVGWLNQYTGRVRPSLDRWRSNDGSMNSRIVTASGQVYCTRTPMPTMEQIFNPSMGGAATMIWRCGRERPEPLDEADPWVRRPSR